MNVLTRIVQHILIWAAACWSIVLGMSWAYAYGFRTQRYDRWAGATLGATMVVVFAGALVQRAPSAVVALVALCACLAPLGIWLIAHGATTSGIACLAVSALYVTALAPASLRWIRDGSRAH